VDPPNAWQLKIPGGKEKPVDQHSKVKTACRELGEETGVILLHPNRIFSPQEFHTDPPHLSYLRHFYAAEEKEFNFRNMRTGELRTSQSIITPPAWVDLDEFVEDAYRTHKQPARDLEGKLRKVYPRNSKPRAATAA
jgi:ADP-ribose pyrophosphatase YjhB (NUDIX family)